MKLPTALWRTTVRKGMQYKTTVRDGTIGFGMTTSEDKT